MKTGLLIAGVILFIGTAFSAPSPTPVFRSNEFTANSSEVATFTSYQPAMLIIQCGKGRVEISCKDGKVNLIGCDIDQASREFWQRISEAYPAFREAAIKSVEKK